MSTWAARSIAAITGNGQDDSAISNRSAGSNVLAVPTLAVSGKLMQVSSVLSVPSHSIGDKKKVVPKTKLDPDRWCWPHSAAMNGEEINRFTYRLHRFTAKGLTFTESEALADKLVVRDRELDNGRSCLECKHLAGYGQTGWRCCNWQNSSLQSQSQGAQLAGVLVIQLQDCRGYA